MLHIVFFGLIFLLSACESVDRESARLVLKSASFSDLPGWGDDDLKTAALAFDKSCTRIQKRDSNSAFGVLGQAGTYADWQKICGVFAGVKAEEAKTLRRFFETHFQPWQALAGDEEEGLFTGYYEASLRGSRSKQGPYKIPIYGRPDDLVMVHLGAFREDLKGRRIAGRVKNGTLKPYEDRAQIVDGKWPHNDQVLLWVDSAVDAFFVQIQGSGVVKMTDGSEVRIGYAGQNGHPYYAIGRELVKRGYMEKEDVSMQSIRRWLENNPRQADEIMNTNRSYVFFQTLKGEGPLGGEGVPLTPGRSLAVDRTLISYGVPIWGDFEPPVDGEDHIRRLMVAQDTGGAIRGPVRGDVFWGYGDRAEYLAGHMKSKGRYWLLLPRLRLSN